ncbi:hypothetical protein GCM10027176_64040 [Actinoallomurus bryophytorum]|uniref:Uncharacterized protein n=1 Tax=Actinoallomurus bryophytorum TaxID=1490222 RepID=A0A543CVH4_9ACTN|nr:hypothetical protein [Actinoallomurus bryophytorum]TQM01071.1 hypothetical protein FB559_6814 [Actinoallomurus bryophytorum]
MKCTYCGAIGLEPGFIMDAGEGRGYAKWVQGALERGPLGGAKLVKRPKWQIEVFRCLRCAHLEMFAANRV